MARTFAKNKMAMVFLFILIMITLFSYVGPLIYHTNQSDMSKFLDELGCNNARPSPKHILGRDFICFDMLGRLMEGGRNSLSIGFAAGIGSMIIGILYGLFSGFRGGWVDSFMMRILDVLLSIPGLYLLFISVTIFGRSKSALILILSVTGWYGIARILRAETLTLREREYAQAVHSMGGSGRRVIFRHLLPNQISTTVTLGTFAVADSILALAGLGFLGVGIALPDTDWGTILNTNFTAIILGYWWEIWPVILLFLLVVMSFNYIGDALRDAFEVRLRDR